MGSKPKAPDTPDYVGAAKETGQQNLEFLNQQTQANRPTQTNPFGTSTWTKDDAGNWTNNQSYSPQMQGLFDNYTSNINKQGTAAGNYLDQFTNNSGQYTGMMDDLVKKAQGVTGDNVTNALMERMQPYLDKNKASLQSSLAAQGLTLNSEAYNTGMDTQSRAENDARLAAITQGDASAGQQLNNITQQYALTNALKNDPLGTYQSLISGTQVGAPTFSSFTNAGAATAPDLQSAMSNEYTADLNKANAGKSDSSGLMSGIGTLGGAAVGAYFGGPLGAQVGASAGGALGGMAGGIF
jgi:hypothetical protein